MLFVPPPPQKQRRKIFELCACLCQKYHNEILNMLPSFDLITTATSRLEKNQNSAMRNLQNMCAEEINRLNPPSWGVSIIDQYNWHSGNPPPPPTKETACKSLLVYANTTLSHNNTNFDSYFTIPNGK